MLEVEPTRQCDRYDHWKWPKQLQHSEIYIVNISVTKTDRAVVTVKRR